MKITKVKVFTSSKQRGKKNHAVLAQVFNDDTGLSVCYFNSTESEDEATANAEVCANALEVANKTGLYPNQILEQRDELLDFVNRIQGEMCRNDFVIDERWADQAEKLIQSIEKE